MQSLLVKYEQHLAVLPSTIANINNVPTLLFPLPHTAAAFPVGLAAAISTRPVP